MSDSGNLDEFSLACYLGTLEHGIYDPNDQFHGPDLH